MAWKLAGAAKGTGGEEWQVSSIKVDPRGTLTVTGTFRIDGNVKGNIISEQPVILAKGQSRGQIEAIVW